MSVIGDSIRRRHGGPRRPAPEGPKPPLRWGRLALFGLLGTILAFGIGYAVAVFLLFPAPAAAAPGIVVPRLIGQDTFYARGALAERGLRLGVVTQVPDPAAAVGTVVGQDALDGQQLRRGATVNVAVSSGAARATLPNVAGYAATRAAALLGALGFQVTQQLAADPSPAGRVVRLSPAPGLEYELPATVLITISSGPPPPDSTAADSTAAADTAHAAPGAPAVPGAQGPGVTPGAPAAAPHATSAAAPAPHPAARDTAHRGDPGGGAPQVR